MNIVPVSQNYMSSAMALLSKNQLPTEDLSEFAKIFVLEDGNEILGTVGLEYSDGNGLLRSLSVDQARRSRGLGKELVSFIEAYARNQGVRHLFILTTTAEGFFSKNNYSKIERSDVPEFIRQTSEFSSVCPSSAVIMKKIL